MIERGTHLGQLRTLLAEFPVVGLIGARQVGKTLDRVSPTVRDMQSTLDRALGNLPDSRSTLDRTSATVRVV